MPLLSAFDLEPILDRRQSPAALKVRRGVGRLLRELGFAVVPELTLHSGRRADLVALGPGSEIWIVEIKSCLADLRADTKWHHYKRACDRLYFATMPEIEDAFPDEEGLILTDGYGAEIAREAPMTRLPAAIRRTMILRIAQTAARRLHEIEDPAERIAVPV